MAADQPELIDVEVAYATPRAQQIVSLRVPRGTTAEEAIEQSGIRIRFPEIEARPKVGIFSRKISLEQELQEGDRVEIYRPLIADPKEVRRQQAEKERSKKM